MYLTDGQRTSGMYIFHIKYELYGNKLMNRCLIKEDSIYFISLYLEFYVQDSLCSVMSMTEFPHPSSFFILVQIKKIKKKILQKGDKI